MDNFSVSWTKTGYFSAGSYTFTVTVDDGVVLWIDGTKIIDQWKDQPETTYTANISLSSGNHVIKLDYYESFGDAAAKLNWVKN